MYSHKQNYFGQMTKSYSLMKLVDVYDSESFIREYILDNVFVCIFMYILFYFVVWYAHKVIKQIERKNQEMLVTVERNKSRLNDIVALKNKRTEYDEIVIKAKTAQKLSTKQLDNEIKKLTTELVSTMSKLNELERFLAKWKFWKNCPARSPKKIAVLEGEFPEGIEAPQDSLENIKTEPISLRDHNPTESAAVIRFLHSRYSTRRSHRPSLSSRPHGNSVSLPDHPEQRPRKSDSSSRASAETSSTESSYRVSNLHPKYHIGQGDRRSHSRRLSSKKYRPHSNVKRIPTANISSTAFYSRSTLDLSSAVFDHE